MDLKEYSIRALRLNNDMGNEKNLCHAVLGITSEAGEIADQYKKYFAYGRALDNTNMVEEAGDLLWFINLMLETLGYTLQQAMEANIAKLETRYANLTFDANAATNRDKAAEMAAVNKVI